MKAISPDCREMMKREMNSLTRTTVGPEETEEMIKHLS